MSVAGAVCPPRAVLLEKIAKLIAKLSYRMILLCCDFGPGRRLRSFYPRGVWEMCRMAGEEQGVSFLCSFYVFWLLWRDRGSGQKTSFFGFWCQNKSAVLALPAS